jgi:hypothetical protein
MARAKTIQIFLPSGKPQGLRVSEITTRIIRAIEVPRAALNEFLAMPEAQQVALYFLLGDPQEGDSLQLYIGQTGKSGERLQQHHQKKSFWNKALVVVSLTNSLTQTHVGFLEWFAIKEAKAAGRYDVLNANGGVKPHTPVPLEADCAEIHETAALLVATLGHPVFEKLVTSEEKAHDVFVCKSAGGADARGVPTSEGFVVLAGSKSRPTMSAASAGSPIEKRRAALQQDGSLVAEGGVLVFKKDVLFSSPSQAAAVVLALSASNGWDTWKQDGKTLSELKRGTPAPVPVGSGT